MWHVQLLASFFPACTCFDSISTSVQSIIPTFFRDGLGVGVWFVSFAAAKDLLKSIKKENQPLELYDLLLAGSCAGVAFWTGNPKIMFLTCY